MTSSEVESISAELPDPLLERPIPRPSRSSSDPSPLAKNHAYFGAGTKGSNPPCSSRESSELRSRDRRPERRDLGFGADRGHVARWPARRRLLDWAIRAVNRKLRVNA